jgi:hypothetical protein
MIRLTSKKDKSTKSEKQETTAARFFHVLSIFTGIFQNADVLSAKPENQNPMTLKLLEKFLKKIIDREREKS